jgi:ABC-type polysaccharide/polyol phosphate export permease
MIDELEASRPQPAETPATQEDGGPDEEAPFEEFPPWRPSVWGRVTEAWQGRHLFPPLARRMVPTYRGRVLGRAWIIIRPFMQVFGFALVFGGVFHAQGPNGIPYLLFLLFSMQAFRLFDLTTLFETMSPRMVARQTRNLRVPLLLVPLASISRGILELIIFWFFAAVTLVYYWIARGTFYLELSPKLLVGLLGLLLCLVYGMALGLTTSVIYPRARDIRYVVRYGMQFWLCVTPVFYSLQTLPSWAQVLAQFNPLTPLISLVQYGFLGADLLHPWGVLWSLGAIVVSAAFGLWFFNRLATQWIGIYAPTDDGDDEDGDLI